MDALHLFTQFPDVDEAFQAGQSEFFLKESEAKDYSKHFNVSYKKVYRADYLPNEVKEAKEEEKPKDTKKAEEEAVKKATKEAKKAEEEAAKKAAEEAKTQES